LAIRWIKNACKAKKGKKMALKLAEEFIDASNKTGAAMKKREDVHRMADANKAFAHFA
jgi:small subunit ribosomal protein S7